MRYVKAKQVERFEAKAYRIYVSDSLKALMNNPQNPRYTEFIKIQKVETRTADEVIADIKERINKG